MSVISMPPGGTSQRRVELVEALRLRRTAWQRALRLWSGVILFAFLTMHLLNHGLGIFGLDVMEEVQKWRIAIWQSLPGTVLLYGALATHAFFALKRMLARQTLRMPLDEALQIILGLLVPALLVDHVVGTRIAAAFFQGDQSYNFVLRRLWEGRPILQTLLVICAWTHGVIGLDKTLRTKNWFAPWRVHALVLAVLVPVLGLAGFVAGTREARQVRGEPPALTPEQHAGAALVGHWAKVGLGGAAGALLIIFAFNEFQRRRRGRVAIRYVGHGTVRVPRGLSILEASRINRIPHPARCGGRGRCSTCRVLVTDGLDNLPDPLHPERKMLERISAPRNVRLACQVRPHGDLAVQVLLEPISRSAPVPAREPEEIRSFGEERTVTVLVVDMRAFNVLARRQLPYDLVILVNRFIAEMTQAVKAHGGRVETLVTDGITAVFGLNSERRWGSREAILAARDMLKACRVLDAELGSALPLPLRIGIGVHTGRAIVAQIADPQLGTISVTMGETVSIAVRLEAATKSMLADCLVSDAALTASGLKLTSTTQREVLLPGLDRPILAHVVGEAAFEPQVAA